MRSQLAEVEDVADFVAGNRDAADLHAHVVAEDAAWPQVLWFWNVGDLFGVEAVEEGGIELLVLGAILRRIPLFRAPTRQQRQRQQRQPDGMNEPTPSCRR